MKKLVSIIVPVYNCAEYLPGCIESILSQTYPHIQLILVDDGSTDGSGKICDSYASADSRIQVIHQENQGVSAARNVGMDRMVGDYLLFVDGDDMLVSNAIDIALKGFVSPEINVVIFGVTKIRPDGKEIQELPINNGVYSYVDVLYGMLSDYASYGAGFPVNKLWKVQMFGSKENILRFDTGLYFFEDMDWVVRMLCYSKTVNILPEHLYQYVIHSDSVTHNEANQERRELGYHQSMWAVLNTLEQIPEVRTWFAGRYYPQLVNGVIHAHRQGWKHQRSLLANEMVRKTEEILSAQEISLKTKIRCAVLWLLHRTGIL